MASKTSFERSQRSEQEEATPLPLIEDADLVLRHLSRRLPKEFAKGLWSTTMSLPF